MVSSSLAKKLSLITLLGLLLLSACGSADNNIAESQSVSSSLDSSDTIMNEEASLECVDNSDSTNELSNEDITPQDVSVDVGEVEESTVNEEGASDSTITPDSPLPTPDTPTPDSSLPTYTITPFDSPRTLYAQSSVSIRSYPSTDGEKVGSFKQNDQIIVVGQCEETGWYQLEDGNFVTNSKKFVGNEKYVVESVSASANDSGSVSESVGSESVSVSEPTSTPDSSLTTPELPTPELPTPEPAQETTTPDSTLPAPECPSSPDGKHFSVKDTNIWFDATLCAYCGTHTSCYHEGYTATYGLWDEEVGHSYGLYTCPTCGVFYKSYALN